MPGFIEWFNAYGQKLDLRMNLILSRSENEVKPLECRVILIMKKGDFFIAYILISCGLHGNCLRLPTSKNFVGSAPFSPTKPNATWQTGPGLSPSAASRHKKQVSDPRPTPLSHWGKTVDLSGFHCNIVLAWQGLGHLRIEMFFSAGARTG